MRLASARIICNPKKPQAKALARKVTEFLAGKGVRIEGRGPAPSILITIGGDGTLLYNKFASTAPIFAIGTSKSFICQSKGKDWKQMLSAIARSGFRVEKRAMLECVVSGKAAGDALNDIALKSGNHRVIHVGIACGKMKARFYADGVLFSTPTGSSAYCYSCGGKQLPPLSKKYEITGIAPHRRAFKPLVVPGSSQCLAWTESSGAVLVLDGQRILRAPPGEKIRIRKSRKHILLVRA